MSHSQRLIQIRTYQLAPDARDAFHRAFVDEAVPMLRRWQHEIVAFGPSPHAGDAYFLIRAYDDLDDLNARQDAFYGSPEWRQGPRERVLAMIRHLPGCGTVGISRRDRRPAAPQSRRRGAHGLSRIHASQHPPEWFRPGFNAVLLQPERRNQ